MGYGLTDRVLGSTPEAAAFALRAAARGATTVERLDEIERAISAYIDAAGSLPGSSNLASYVAFRRASVRS
jgi:hypothetical protein